MLELRVIEVCKLVIGKAPQPARRRDAVLCQPVGQLDLPNSPFVQSIGIDPGIEKSLLCRQQRLCIVAGRQRLPRSRPLAVDTAKQRARVVFGFDCHNCLVHPGYRVRPGLPGRCWRYRATFF